MAWRRREAEKCPRCGTHPDEWERDPFAYVAEPIRCPGCELTAQAQDQIPPGEKGVIVTLIRRLFRRPPAEEM